MRKICFVRGTQRAERTRVPRNEWEREVHLQGRGAEPERGKVYAEGVSKNKETTTKINIVTAKTSDSVREKGGWVGEQ